MDPQVGHAERVARAALAEFGLSPQASLSFVKQRENTVFRVQDGDEGYALRVARPGYRSDAEIAAEVAFVNALGEQGIEVPAFRAARDGSHVVAPIDDGMRFQVVVQTWVEDAHPLEDIANAYDGTSVLDAADFAAIGELAARVHRASAAAGRSPGYDRPAWDAAGLVGPRPLWGDPCALEEHSTDDVRVLREAAASLGRRLAGFGTDAEVFGVLHADFTPENLLRRADGTLLLIDFDDSGEGWHAFDLATTLFFFQPHPRYGEYRAALETGYSRATRSPERTLSMLDAMILARGMTYLGWAGERRGDETAEFLAAEVRPLVLDLARKHLAGPPADRPA